MNTIVIKGSDFSEHSIGIIDFDGIHTERISISPIAINATQIGDAIQITTTVVPSDSEDRLSFRSTDTNVATVSSSGMVEIVGCGECSIIATSGSRTATCAVSVAIELNVGKYRSAYSGSANSSNMLTSVSYTGNVGANDNYMLMCNGETEYTHLMINYYMTTLSNDVYVVTAPADMTTGIKKVYDYIGYPIPVVLPPNTKKIRCIAPTGDYAVYPMIFKHAVEAAASGAGTINRAHYSPMRVLIDPISSYSFVYQETTDVIIPDEYDSVALTWKVNGTGTNFRDMSSATLEEFKIICM